MGLKRNSFDLSSFSALTLLVGSFDLEKPVPDMTCNVFGGTLNLTQSTNQPWSSLLQLGTSYRSAFMTRHSAVTVLDAF